MQNEDVSQGLKDMGFQEDQIAIALKHSGDKTLEGLINWIDAHPNLEEFIGKEPSTGGAMDTEKVQGEGEKATEEEKAAEEEGQSISGMVNQEFATVIEGMGYSKNVREKALLMTSNGGVEQALEWIEQHREDPDFEEEMKVVGEKKKLSPEEAAQKARELQERIRENRRKKEEEDAFEREKNRVASGKALTEAKRLLAETEKKRDIDIKMKEKREDEVYKQKLLEEMEREKAAKFGKDYVMKKNLMEENPEEKLNKAMKQMRTVYPTFSYPDTIRTCLTTIKTILGNILKNPTEQKFQKINLSNENFKNRVGDIVGGIFILNQCGFQEEEGFLILKDLNKMDFLPKAIAIMDREILNLS
jgi:hypothetical protein